MKNNIITVIKSSSLSTRSFCYTLQNYQNAKHNDMLQRIIIATLKSDPLDRHQKEKVEKREKRSSVAHFVNFVT